LIPATPAAVAESAGLPRGDVVKWLNTEVCKTSIQRFESARRLHLSGTATLFTI
jgi:hypothetical protein